LLLFDRESADLATASVAVRSERSDSINFRSSSISAEDAELFPAAAAATSSFNRSISPSTKVSR
jgi:hypothetical protein